jgi:hypothetical protein
MTIAREAKKLAQQVLPEPLKKIVSFGARKKRALLGRSTFSFSNAPESPRKSAFPFSISRDNPLEKLGEKYLPTKRLHNYLVYYWMHFRDIRFEVRRVVEIGVQSDRSIRMWEDFFPNATIYGVDIDPQCARFEGGRRKILIGDQGDPDVCRRLLEKTGGELDIVIDDGSHRVDHQLRSFGLLFPAMTDHGIYVVEDTGGCVDDADLVTVNVLKQLVDSIMYWPKGFSTGDWPHLTDFPEETKWIHKNVVGIAFYRWIVFVMRGNNPQDNPYLTPRSDR